MHCDSPSFRPDENMPRRRIYTGIPNGVVHVAYCCGAAIVGWQTYVSGLSTQVSVFNVAVLLLLAVAAILCAVCVLDIVYDMHEAFAGADPGRRHPVRYDTAAQDCLHPHAIWPLLIAMGGALASAQVEIHIFSGVSDATPEMLSTLAAALIASTFAALDFLFLNGDF